MYGIYNCNCDLEQRRMVKFDTVKEAEDFLKSIYNSVELCVDQNGVHYFNCHFFVWSSYKIQRWVIGEVK